jgi:putative ABC transport system permease protein
MLRFAIKNLIVRRSKIILICISIIIASTVGIIALNISNQIEEGIIKTTGYYDMIIGPQGSQTQLALSTMFFSDNPLGTISYEYYETLKNDSRVNVAIPMAMGDSYKNHKIIGTSIDFLKDKKYDQGQGFEKEFDTVIGYNVAKSNNLKVGDTFISSHGISEVGAHEHEKSPYIVVGILKKTNTVYDNHVFTPVESVWEAHSYEEEEHEEALIGEEEYHEHVKELTAIIIRTKSMQDQLVISSSYNQKLGLQAINPTQVIRGILENIDLTKQIVFVLCFIIFVMSILIIYIITLLNIYDTRKDIHLMRVLGISQKKITTIFIIQNMIVTIISIVISAIFSRVVLVLINGFTSSMGIVLDVLRIYKIEGLMLFIVLIICLLPTIIVNIKLFKKDPILD